MQQSEKSYRFPCWPFWLADGLLLIWAALVWGFSEEPHSAAANSFYVLAVFLAFVFGIAPIYIERWLYTKERQRRLESEYQSQVARALGEILDRLADSRKEEKPVPPAENAVDWLKPALEVIGDQLATMHTHLERLSQREEPQEGKRGGRRGVNGILYPPKGKASWVNQEESVDELFTAEESNHSNDTAEDHVEPTPRMPVEVWVMALIGIGNKPYLRGNLPGLSDSQGVPMEFVEIGKWRWIGEDVEDLKNLSVEVWLNDVIPAKDNPVIVTDHITEIRPIFP
jgi:hypothetical protein